MIVQYANIMELVRVKDAKDFSRYFDRSTHVEIEAAFVDKAITTAVSLRHVDVHIL